MPNNANLITCVMKSLEVCWRSVLACKKHWQTGGSQVYSFIAEMELKLINCLHHNVLETIMFWAVHISIEIVSQHGRNVTQHLWTCIYANAHFCRESKEQKTGKGKQSAAGKSISAAGKQNMRMFSCVFWDFTRFSDIKRSNEWVHGSFYLHNHNLAGLERSSPVPTKGTVFNICRESRSEGVSPASVPSCGDWIL